MILKNLSNRIMFQKCCFEKKNLKINDEKYKNIDFIIDIFL